MLSCQQEEARKGMLSGTCCMKTPSAWPIATASWKYRSIYQWDCLECKGYTKSGYFRFLSMWSESNSYLNEDVCSIVHTRLICHH